MDNLPITEEIINEEIVDDEEPSGDEEQLDLIERSDLWVLEDYLKEAADITRKLVGLRATIMLTFDLQNRIKYEDPEGLFLSLRGELKNRLKKISHRLGEKEPIEIGGKLIDLNDTFQIESLLEEAGNIAIKLMELEAVTLAVMDLQNKVEFWKYDIEELLVSLKADLKGRLKRLGSRLNFS